MDEARLWVKCLLWAANLGQSCFMFFHTYWAIGAVGGGGGVSVGPSDNLCTDSTAATWRWNVNTFRLSGSSHICLHPSSCPRRSAPPSPLFLFYRLFYRCGIPLNPNSWQNQMVLFFFRRLRRFIFPRCGTAFAFLLVFFLPFFGLAAYLLCRSTGFPFYGTERLQTPTSHPPPPPLSVPQIVMDAHAEAKLLNYPIRHLASL